MKYAFLTIGLSLGAVSLILWWRTRRFAAESLRVQGTVVGLLKRWNSEGTKYRPVVRFMSHDGQEVQFTDPVGALPAGYRIGDQVEVLYDPQDHKRARLASPFRLYFGPFVVGFLGVALTVVSAGVIFFGDG